MKYLVKIESLDYTKQRDLENKFETVYLKSLNDNERLETWLVVDNKEKAEKIEKAILAFNELFT